MYFIGSEVNLLVADLLRVLRAKLHETVAPVLYYRLQPMFRDFCQIFLPVKSMPSNLTFSLPALVQTPAVYDFNHR